MKGVKNGAYLLMKYKSGRGYKGAIIHISDMHKGHYKLNYQELQKSKGRKKKNLESFFWWSTIINFKKEARRLKMKVISSEEASKYSKEGI